MRSSTYEEFIVIYDNFRDFSVAQVKHFLEIARSRVPQGVWGGKTKWGTYLLTAHFLTLQTQQEAQDIAAADAIGQGNAMSVPSWENNLTRTSYGEMFKDMRDEIAVKSAFHVL